MTEEQKRFKILERKSYEEQISQANKKATRYTFLFGVVAVALSISFLAAQQAVQQNFNTSWKLFNLGAILWDIGCEVCYLKKLIESIIRKTNLQIRVEDIDRELKMFGEEEEKSNKGRGGR